MLLSPRWSLSCCNVSVACHTVLCCSAAAVIMVTPSGVADMTIHACVLESCAIWLSVVALSRLHSRVSWPHRMHAPRLCLCCRNRRQLCGTATNHGAAQALLAMTAVQLLCCGCVPHREPCGFFALLLLLLQSLWPLDAWRVVLHKRRMMQPCCGRVFVYCLCRCTCSACSLHQTRY